MDIEASELTSGLTLVAHQSLILRMIREARNDYDVDLVINMVNTLEDEGTYSEEMLTIFVNFCLSHQRFKEASLFLERQKAYYVKKLSRPHDTNLIIL